jgi:hypothetical protein
MSVNWLQIRIRLLGEESKCERSLGTGFQLPSQNAIYNQTEEKRKKSGSHLALFGFAHGPQGREGKRQGKRKEARPRA